jgi:AbrB family looped-hinge helix DNA binding protein
VQTVQLREHHRIVIPADVVRALELHVGDRFIFEMVDGMIVLIPQRKVIGALQSDFAQVAQSLADRLLATRQDQK